MGDDLEDVRFGLVGCGKIAKKHVEAIDRLQHGRLVGACDVDSEKAEAFGEENSLAVFGNAKEMVEETSPDVLNILTPSGAHTDTVLDLVPLGCHFVIEKPLGLKLSHVDRVLEEARTFGCRLFVVQQNRFNPPIQKLKQAIDAGRFGRMVLGSIRVRWTRHQAYYDEKSWRGTWKGDGGVLTNQASHHLDMLLWLMGNVENVVAKTATQLVDIETEDTGAAILNFANGAVGIVEATTATRPRDLGGSISILGEKGAVKVGGFYMNELETWNFEDEHEMDENIWEKHATVPEEFAWNHTRYLEDVVRSIRHGTEPIADGQDGRRCVQLLHAIYRSAETGRVVTLADEPRSAHLGRGP